MLPTVSVHKRSTGWTQEPRVLLMTPPPPIVTPDEAYATAYLRISDADQNSLESQLDLIHAQAARLGVTIPQDAIYIDRGESRDLYAKRGALQQMLERIYDPKCKYVIVWIYSRLYSGTDMQLEIYRHFRKAQVRVFDSRGAEENTPDHNQKLNELINAWKSEGEVLELRRRVRETHEARAQRGRLISRPPYGISVVSAIELPCGGTRCNSGGRECEIPHGELSDKNNTAWVINHEQVAVLEMIYQWAAEGVTMGYIIERLTALGITAPLKTVKRGKNAGRIYGGQMWSKSNLRKMILNPFYRGEVIWNQYTTVREGMDNKKRVPNPESEWIRRNHALGPIIDPALFDEAGRQIARRNNTRDENRKYDTKLWDGFIVCGRCGWKMYPRRRSHKNRNGWRAEPFDYVCAGVYNDYSSCSVHHSIPESWLNAMLTDDLTKVMPEGRIDVVYNREIEDTTGPELKVLEDQLIELKTQLDSLEGLALAGFYKPEVAVQKKRELEAQREQAIARRDELLAGPGDDETTTIFPVEFANFGAALTDPVIPVEERRVSLGRLVDRVVVDRPRVRFVLRAYPL